MKSVLLYGCETWRTTQTIQRKIHTFFNTCLRRTYKIQWQEKIRNEGLWERAGQGPVAKQILWRKWGWIGHNLRKPASSTTRQALTWNPQGKRKRDRPRNRWRRDTEAEMEQQGTNWSGITRAAQNRVRWRGSLMAYAQLGAMGINKFVCLCVWLAGWLRVSLSQSVCVSFCLFVCLSVFLSVSLTPTSPSVCLLLTLPLLLPFPSLLPFPRDFWQRKQEFQTLRSFSIISLAPPPPPHPTLLLIPPTLLTSGPSTGHDCGHPELHAAGGPAEPALRHQRSCPGPPRGRGRRSLSWRGVQHPCGDPDELHCL